MRHIQQFIAFLLLSPHLTTHLIFTFMFFGCSWRWLNCSGYSILLLFCWKPPSDQTMSIEFFSSHFQEKYQLSQTTSTNRLFTFWSRTQWTQYDRIPPWLNSLSLLSVLCRWKKQVENKSFFKCSSWTKSMYRLNFKNKLRQNLFERDTVKYLKTVNHGNMKK